ncbi:hypothetical protein SLEP1_g750 [Rubroshorea leprosula]|uniref:Uncharacterized protein n=1 Tax=Rubroshorea leprosula TaxID=152421 RepID=A0AAV5HL06_9ROSI|nr:hypothetical protein SLEP1_g750 [Rubroshorea leprosula]
MPESPFQVEELPSTSCFCFSTKPENNGTKETPNWSPNLLRLGLEHITMPTSASSKQSKSPIEAPT